MRRFGQRKWIRIVTSVLLLAVLVGEVGGCADSQEFRATTASAFQSGAQTILNGLLDGLFAVYTPNSTSSN